MIDGASVSEVLAAAKADGCRDYDQIGYRIQSTCTTTGVAPLQTLAGALAAEDREKTGKARRARILRRELQHISFGFQFPDARMSFEITEQDARFQWQKDGETVTRVMSLADPPDAISQHTYDRDAGPLLAQHIQISGHSDIWWLPYSELLNEGRFVRMQDWSDRISVALDPQSFYIFISHRWLTPNQPDPDGKQAALIAWQVLGHLINAIWVGQARGQHTPRKISALGPYIGPNGSELAESILVNLLRSLPEQDFDNLVIEAEAFEDIEDDYGARLALQDTGLQSLRARLQQAPCLRRVLDRFRVWYDYSCMPQLPRSPEEEERFEHLLTRLGAIQALGRTVVLLNTAEDYYSRGWCTYESTLSGEQFSGLLDVVCGGDGDWLNFKDQASDFMIILSDRAHLIWRGILDTEIFGIQTAEECMSRLGLQTTRPEDRLIVYSLLRDLGPTRSIHYDGGEVLTGVFPLPIREEKVLVIAESGRAVEDRNPELTTIQVPERISLREVGSRGLPPFASFDGQPSSQLPTAHVAVFGRCEGEAILYTLWALENRLALEGELGISVRSLSWVASDVAPVGHFAIGELTIQPVEAEIWVTLGADSTLAGGYTPRILTETLWKAGIEYLEISIDNSTENVRRYHPSTEKPSEDVKQLKELDLGDPAFKTYPGGLFRPQLMQSLRARP